MMRATPTTANNNNNNNRRTQQSRHAVSSFDPYAVKQKNVAGDSDEESDVFQDISGAESTPLVNNSIATSVGNTMSRRRFGKDDNKSGYRSRGSARNGNSKTPASDEYSYSPIMDPFGGNNSVNGASSPPPIHRQPLQSLTIGGYGPIPTNDPSQNSPDDANDDPQQKSRPQSFVARTIHWFSSCTKKYGCSSHQMMSEEGPDKNYYRDDFNNEPRGCSCGTKEEDGIWTNTSDQAGSIMAFMVWFLLGYSSLTILWLAGTGGVPATLSMIYCILCCLALSCHAKTTLTDPGSVPQSAVPVEALRRQYPDQQLSMCSQCQTFKPPFSHHCRICNRCVSRMDHHCPWMNNCIGAGNLKHFILFLVYTWTTSTFAMILLGWNYFFCATEDCTFGIVVIQLARVMTFLSIGAFLFTSSMIMNVCYGLMTGIGTIDRLKKKATNTMMDSDEEPIPLKDVFGIAGYHTWLLPIDPVFEDYDRVMGYSTPQRLLREQMMVKPRSSSSAPPPIQMVGTNSQYIGNIVSKDLMSV